VLLLLLVLVSCITGGAHIDLVPYRYLFQVDGGHFCLGMFDNGYQGTLLGGIITRNMLVTVSHLRNTDVTVSGPVDMDPRIACP
jgi:hypothetical protein